MSKVFRRDDVPGAELIEEVPVNYEAQPVTFLHEYSNFRMKNYLEYDVTPISDRYCSGFTSQTQIPTHRVRAELSSWRAPRDLTKRCLTGPHLGLRRRRNIRPFGKFDPLIVKEFATLTKPVSTQWNNRSMSLTNPPSSGSLSRTRVGNLKRGLQATVDGNYIFLCMSV